MDYGKIIVSSSEILLKQFSIDHYRKLKNLVWRIDDDFDNEHILDKILQGKITRIDISENHLNGQGQNG